jgi:hypothetical protein
MHPTFNKVSAIDEHDEFVFENFEGGRLRAKIKKRMKGITFNDEGHHF